MMKFTSKLKVQLPLALGLSLVSNYSMKLPAASSADVASIFPNAIDAVTAPSETAKTTVTSNMSIRNIYLNEDKQLVVEFDNPSHAEPGELQVKDYPGQKHDIVLEFPKTSFAIDKAPKAKAVLDELMKIYPDLNSVAYATATDGTRARIRIGVSPNVSVHPSIVKLSQDNAVINLDLPITEKNAVASATTASQKIAADKPATVIAAAADSKVITATDAPVEHKGVAIKTLHGIKGAWTSGLKASHDKISKLNPIVKHKSAAETAEPAVASKADVESAAPVAEEKKAVEPSVAEQTTSKIDLLASLKEPVENITSPTSVADQAAPATASSAALATTNTDNSQSGLLSLKPAITPVESVQAPETTKVEQAPAATTPAAVTETTASTSATTLAAVTETTASTSATTPAAVTETTASTSATTPAAVTETTASISGTKPAAEIPNVDAVPTLVVATLPTSADKEIANLPKADTNLNEPIVSPLSVEQVLKEKASFEAANPKPPLAEDTTSPSVSITPKSDKSVVTDLTTGFSKPPVEKTDEADKKEVVEKTPRETKKEDADKIANVPPNPLDNLTNAAISNAASEQNTEEVTQTSPAVKLKSQKAHQGGKDYYPPKFNDDAVEHYNAAVRAHLSGKLTEAITEYQTAIEYDEKIAEAYSNLGLIYNQMHKYDQAMTQFHKALVINPKDAITYNGIGAAMRAKNNLLAAIKNWQTAITIDPNLASAHYNLGTAYELSKDMEKALAQYKEAVKYDDKLGEAYYRMGLILQKMNNKNLALEEYKQAIKVSQQASYTADAKRRINLLSQTKNNTM
jgi:tetratricopeptide (TPR) repeat protein